MWIEKTVDRESQQKLYVQMYSIIKDKVESKEWPNGSQIPTEDELCRTYDVSKATVRMAVSELVRAGYLKKLQGKGTFVTYMPHNLGVTMKTKLTENMLGEGASVTREVLLKEVKAPSEQMKTIFRSFEDEEDDDLFYMVCRRSVNGETAYLEETYMPLSVLPGIVAEDVCRRPFYDLIQEKGTQKIVKVVQTIEVTDIDAGAASLLGTEEGTPGLLLHRLLIGAEAKPLAYTRLLGEGKKYKLQTEFERLI